MSIVSITTTIDNLKLIKLNRELTLDDLELKFRLPPASVENLYGYANYGLDAKLNPEAADCIIGTLTDNGDKSLMKHFVEITTVHRDSFQFEVNFRGVQQNNRQKHYDKLLKTFNEEAEQRKESDIAKALAHMNDVLKSAIEKNNTEFKNSMSKLVVEQSVNEEWLSGVLTEGESKVVTESEEEIDLIDIQIKQLQAKKAAAKLTHYDVRRQRIVKELKKVLCEDGNEMLKELEKVECPSSKTINYFS
ncbi:hypothetical protein [Vibrio sp. D431a]|uniref:hypothetical protein n=1 Tax=Vibrio sp. D431a TaxID=2837388 RepID=UPI0025540C4D|nr:hypothetical protein [Vibrio sp. D431a]MDK9793775.1 hypothetical protein [Vibrio sp. D431a]